MKKISILILLILLTNLLAGCGFHSYFNNEEISSERTKQESSQYEDEHVSPSDTDIKTDTGAYQEQIDSSFIKIAILGVPEENAAKVFMLSGELKDEFGDMQLSTGEIIKFRYFIDEAERNVIVKIENQDGERDEK